MGWVVRSDNLAHRAGRKRSFESGRGTRLYAGSYDIQRRVEAGEGGKSSVRVRSSKPLFGSSLSSPTVSVVDTEILYLGNKPSSVLRVLVNPRQRDGHAAMQNIGRLAPYTYYHSYSRYIPPSSPSSCCIISELDHILDKVALSHLIVQLPGWISMLSVPLQPRTIRFPRFSLYSLDHLFTIPFASDVGVNKQV